jgi:hypothetical protein
MEIARPQWRVRASDNTHQSGLQPTAVLPDVVLGDL